MGHIPIVNGRIEFTFTANGEEALFLIYAGVAGETRGNGVIFTNVKLEKGNRATDWTPAPEDTQSQIDGLGSRVTTAETSITQLSNQIQLKANQTTVDSLTNRMSSAESSINLLSNQIKLKVDVDGVISSINLSPEGVRISGNRIHLTGQTLIEDGIIGTAAIANGAITRAKLGTAVIGTAQIEDGAITNAKIANATIDGAKIANASITDAKIANLNVNKLTGSIGTFIQQGWNGITNQVNITGSGLETYSSGERTSLLNGSGHVFYRDGYIMGKIGTTYYSGRPTYRGLAFQLENQADFMAWSHRESPNDSVFTHQLVWHKTSTVTRKGFNFYDDVTINSSYNLSLRKITTIGYTSGELDIQLQNFTWNGNLGVAIRRGSSGAGLFLHENHAALRNASNGSFEVGHDGENRVYSMSVYNRTYTYDPNVFITVHGTLGRATSSRRYKLSEKPITLDYAEKVLKLEPKSWYDKRAIESYAHTLATGEETEPLSIRRIPGLIAEDVHDVGLNMFVEYDEEGQINGINSRIWVLFIPLIRQLRARVEVLEQENELLKEKITKLEEEVL